jgi:hypothetical protein
LLKKTEGKVAVPIVPVGLNYVQKNKFRSNVLIRYFATIILPYMATNVHCAVTASRSLSPRRTSTIQRHRKNSPRSCKTR